MQKRDFLKGILYSITGALTLSPLSVQASPVVGRKVSVFGEQPDDEEGSIVIQNIHADGSYSLSEQIFQEDYV